MSPEPNQPVTEQRPTRARFTVIAAICLAATIAYMGRNCLGVASQDVRADLGIDVIAEGIETTGQLATIAAAGCRLAQGRLFGWPAPITQFDAQWQGGLTGSGADSPAIWHEGD